VSSRTHTGLCCARDRQREKARVVSINFDRAAGYYDATRGYDPDVAMAIGRGLAAAVKATSETRFLEIGVGTGRIALPLAELGYDVTGVDISREMLSKLREKLNAHLDAGRALRLRVEEADAHDLPFQDDTFDAAIAVHVFHLIADARRAVHEVFRVLRPGGALLICADMVEGTEQPSVSDKWREIVRQHGHAVPNSSEAASMLLDHLQSTIPGIVIEMLKPVSWSAKISHAEELDSIRRRLWSQTWRLPDETFERCFDELTAWFDTQYAARPGEQMNCTKEFVIRKVTTPAQAG